MASATETPSGHAVVLFAHGSREPGWRTPIEAVAHRMREMDPTVLVRCAYFELTAPDLAAAVAELIAQDARVISIWPMFLGVGRHVREDLPRLLDQLRADHPDIVFHLEPAIADHPSVLDTMACVVSRPKGSGGPP